MSETIPRNSLAYVATPYTKTGNIERAYQHACALTARLLEAGVSAYSPIAHTHGIAIHGNLDPLDHSIWLPFDEAMMRKADVLIVARMEGWRESYGIAHEVALFEKMRKPIFDLDPVTMRMVRRQEQPMQGVPELLKFNYANAGGKPHDP